MTATDAAHQNGRVGSTDDFLRSALPFGETRSENRRCCVAEVGLVVEPELVGRIEHGHVLLRRNLSDVAHFFAWKSAAQRGMIVPMFMRLLRPTRFLRRAGIVGFQTPKSRKSVRHCCKPFPRNHLRQPKTSRMYTTATRHQGPEMRHKLCADNTLCDGATAVRGRSRRLGAVKNCLGPRTAAGPPRRNLLPRKCFRPTPVAKPTPIISPNAPSEKKRSNNGSPVGV